MDHLEDMGLAGWSHSKGCGARWKPRGVLGVRTGQGCWTPLLGSGIEAPSTSAKDTELCGGKGWGTQSLGRLDLREVKSKFPQPKLRLGGGWTESSPEKKDFG